VFSRKSSSRADSAEPSLPGPAALPVPRLNPDGVEGAADMAEQSQRPLEDNSAQILGQEPVIVDEENLAQPQSERVEPRSGVPEGVFVHPPTVDEVASALEDLEKILNPPRHTGRYKDPELDLLFRSRLEGMRQFMWAYINPNSGTMGQSLAKFITQDS
jgi:hypothetical protein